MFILPIDKHLKVWYNSGSPWIKATEISIIPYADDFVKRKNAQK
nr:MAG TPA: hypothetical protein [Caudoviricetes sp.]